MPEQTHAHAPHAKHVACGDIVSGCTFEVSAPAEQELIEKIVSKPTAAVWVKQNLNHKWTGLIERVWGGRQTPSLEAMPEDIDRTLAFIRYTLEYCHVDQTPVK